MFVFEIPSQPQLTAKLRWQDYPSLLSSNVCILEYEGSNWTLASSSDHAYWGSSVSSCLERLSQLSPHVFPNLSLNNCSCPATHHASTHALTLTLALQVTNLNAKEDTRDYHIDNLHKNQKTRKKVYGFLALFMDANIKIWGRDFICILCNRKFRMSSVCLLLPCLVYLSITCIEMEKNRPGESQQVGIGIW